MRFNVTFETLTEESVEYGETEDAGILGADVPLREALDLLGQGDYCEANEWPVRDPRWVTAYKVDEDYRSGETENRSLHFPEGMTPASKLRVCRLLDCHGV